jgi:protein involved in polysaccharide export with SLBB domain
VLDLRSILDERSADIEVRDGDRLTVPRAPQSVTVLGEVQNATSHLWKQGLDRDDYINMSGGLTAKADKHRIYVVRASGSVVASSRIGWFGRSNADIRPGDVVVAPLDAERMRQLPMWTSVTQILYNLAIAAAAVNSF